MKPLTVSKRTVLAASTIALLLGAACNRTPAPSEATSPVADASASAEQAVAQETKATSNAFDISTVPVSTATLGGFPYIGLPDGYEALRPETNTFERVPFWTGDRLEWVEGQAYGALVQAKGDHPFSQLELNRNIQALVESLGGQRVFSGRIPAEGKEGIQASDAAVNRVDALGDIYNESAEVYVIHRADRDIWLHVAKNGNQAGVLIAETKPVAITAKALPADELKKSLDAAGKVAIQVQFETDQAAILPTSKPQLEQVISLLNENSALRLSINGHTDNTGSASHNLQLSQHRAAAVRDFIIAAGIDQKRLESSGFGDSQPVAQNTTDDGKARNRRVELVKI
ncbi:OmpA family protein [Stenotrophomonas humi]|uniref:OmpA family protein n=1 Tax=Stenotrophomonas humi TaxID=405444 RepID=UPI0009F9C65C|nr:OmpA family protein [Stenotrophomonas humi]